ncbi:hypothetical protein R4Z09_03580 [Niallia oryzisoli]|uniref:Uncharacterized protein n=1 Tax=Niallia oryzisoli TaxID=1737571 RepID=A0ABZ2CEB3_9BACI
MMQLYAAETSDIEEVFIGVTSDVDIRYNPDALRLEFTSKVVDLDCCRLLITLRWR